MKLKQRTTKIITGLTIAIIAILLLVTVVYSDNDNHLVVYVTKNVATAEDDNLEVTESITEEGADTLNYQVKIKNKNGGNLETQVAMVVDTSYSMQNNDQQAIVKQEAKDLATGIFQNVAGVRMSLASNSGVKVALTDANANITTSTNSINTAITNLVSGESQDCNDGLRAALNSFKAATTGKTASKVIIYFTDSTDSVSNEMKRIINENQDVKIINVLVDLTSSEYIDLTTGEPITERERVYVLPSNVSEEDILPENVTIYSKQAIYDELNLSANNIRIENIFTDAIVDNFKIKDVIAQKGTIALIGTDDEATNTYVNELYENENVGTVNTKVGMGYIWNIGQLKFGQSATMSFTIKLSKDAQVDAKYIFEDIYTNKTQKIKYNAYNTEETVSFTGTDSTEGTESTVIKICQGYDLKIKAVNDSNSELQVEGVTLKVTGQNEAGEIVCNVTKTTDSDGYISITANDARSLRTDGIITYSISPIGTKNLVGYENTDSITFAIDNNKLSRNLYFDDMNSGIYNYIEERTRTVEVHMPIVSTKINFEIIAHELNNTNITLSNCEFELIQPKLNSKYEMSVLSGKTDANGILHLNPTVMTQDGTYNYILRQVNAPTAYNPTGLAMIKITYQNGRIVAANTTTNEITTMYNENVKAKLGEDSSSSDIDHVIVKVGDVCVVDNPFDLQINLSDIDDNTIKIDNVTYQITTTDSMGQVRSEYAVTDANGQINTKIYGTGFLTIRIAEQNPKVGYKEEDAAKEIILQRVDGQIILIAANPPELHNTDKYSVRAIQDNDGNAIGVKVDLGSQKKAQQNIVKVKLVDAQNNSISAGSDILYDLVDANGVSYGPEASNSSGELQFTIGNESAGIHTYKLKVNKAYIPTEYDLSKVDEEIELELEFDNNGYITANSKVSSTSPSVINEDWNQTNNSKYLDYTYEVTIAYEIDLSKTFTFNVLLRDKKDKTTALEGAKYNIEIDYKTEQNGVEVIKTKAINKRATNSSGKISTIVPKSEDITIRIKEVEPKVGYFPDTTLQEVELKCLNNGNIAVTAQAPYDLGVTDTTQPDKGVQYDMTSNTVTYYDYNRGRSEEDVYLNLNIRKYTHADMAEADGVYVNVKAAELLDETEQPLDKTIATGSQTYNGLTMNGEIVYDYSSYINNEPNITTIKVPNLTKEDGNPDTAVEKLYEMEITEMKEEPAGSGNFVEKPETKVKLRLIFRNQGYKIKLTNVETIYGNRLVIDKTFSSSSDTEAGTALEDSLGIFLANIQLDLFTEYDDVGNLAIDFQKEGNDGSSLSGAEYDVRVVNPDSTVVKKHITIDNGQDSDSIELKGVTVNKGSMIYISETKAPMGYAVNENTETLEVKEIDETGAVELEHVDNTYTPERLKIVGKTSTITASNTVKNNYTIKLTDYQLDVFKIQVDAIDKDTLDLVNGYNFNAVTTMGAQGNLTSGSAKKIGGNPSDTTVTYTITPTATAQYYKPINSSINVNVVFDTSGNVDTAATMNAQTDTNYGTLWTIANLDATAEGNLKVEIKVEHQEKLKVKVQTIDAITGKTINNVNYSIPESIQVIASGSTDLEVGYVSQMGTFTYTLKQTSIQDDYELLKDNKFTVTYNNGIIDSVSITEDSSVDKSATIQKTGDKEVTIKLYVEPKVPFVVTNQEYFSPNALLQGANFEITEMESEETSNGTTDANGTVTIYNAPFGKNSSKMYIVKQTKAAFGYATVEEFYVKVEYDANRKITAATLVDANGNIVTNNRFVEIGKVNNASNGLDNVTIKVKNYPDFKINITDVDRRDGVTPIAGTTYAVTSSYIDSYNNTQNFMSTSGVVTDSSGLGIAHLDRTKANTVVKYKITETSPATNYQTIATDIEINVTYDQDGFVTKAELVDGSKSNIAEVSTIAGDEGRFTINLQLKNNPLLRFDLTAQDITGNIKIENIGYQIISKFEDTTYSTSSNTNRVNSTGSAQTCYTNAQGLAQGYLDRTLENKEMIYTIKQVKKIAGYEWQNEDIVIKVTYDANGKISTVAIDAGTNFTQINSYDKDNFVISLDIFYEEIKEFGIHVIAQDTYKQEKKISGLYVDAYLTQIGDTTLNIPDGEHEFRLENTATQDFGPDYDYSIYDPTVLLTGADRDQDGVADIAEGEDYKIIGQYETKDEASSETRVLRLRIKNSNYSGIYTNKTTKISKLQHGIDNLGYIEDGKYYQFANYQVVENYQWLVSITFDDEGKITDTHVISPGGLYPQAGGWCVDGRYLEVSHSDYKVNVKMKLFPTLDLTAIAVDNYIRGEATLNHNTAFTVSTMRHSLGFTGKDEFVTAGYIGYPNYASGYVSVMGRTYESRNELYVPIENNSTRKYFIYEEESPEYYQKHRPWYFTQYNQRLIAIVEYTFNEYGEVIDMAERDFEGAKDVIEPYVKESGDGYLANDNIKRYYYNEELPGMGFTIGSSYIQKETEKSSEIQEWQYQRARVFEIGYGLTTQINMITIDDIDGYKKVQTANGSWQEIYTPISNIKVYPCINNDEVSNNTESSSVHLANRSYQYRTTMYNYTGGDGKTNWEYWGAAETNDINRYIIGSSRSGNSYNGYFFPSDLASGTIGGSGNEQDYYVKLDVTYDGEGRIKEVKSLGSDTWGDDNVNADISWDKNTGIISIKMLYSRKFQTKINKIDYYDPTIKLNANFDVISNKGLVTDISTSHKMRTLGKVYKDTTVKYTLSEKQVPTGYYPIESPIEYFVTFDVDGNINKNSVKSTNDYFGEVTTSSTTRSANKTAPDITLNIKNKPALYLNLRVIDKFYKNDGLADVYLKITNDKGDTAYGNPQTDSNGYVTVPASTAYINETVKYYIEQLNTVDGYYPNNQIIELDVTFNESGKIESYSIVQGNEVVNNFNGNAYINSRNISMQIMNMPKDVKLGLHKYDRVNDTAMGEVEFEISKTDMNSGATATSIGNISTDLSGNAVLVADQFETSLNGKNIKYTIHEVSQPEGYRKLQDIEYIVRYANDGHIESYTQAFSSTGVMKAETQVDVASNGIIRYFNGKRVHMKLTVPNDNAFDLIIKNEDTNYAGFGIEGSTFDVSINGRTYTPGATDVNGKTIIEDITDTGELVINVAQHTAGEGYLFDVENHATINLDKGTLVYSLDLNAVNQDGYIDDEHATTTKAEIEVDETYGRVYITFKNETKTEITLLKQDYETFDYLEGAKFEITGQQINSLTGDPIGTPVQITTADNDTTDANGELYFNLGVAPHSEKWVYTFKEVDQPYKKDVQPAEKYDPIIDTQIVVTYDQYGRMTLDGPTSERMNPVMVSSNINCRHVLARVYNGDIPPAYTVKVYTEDYDTHNRINGSEIKLKLTDAQTGNIIAVETKTDGSAQNDASSTTGYLGLDYKKYDTVPKDKPVIDSGMTYIDNVDFHGKLNIQVSQTATAAGYIFGNQKVDGNVQIDVEYIPSTTSLPTVHFDQNTIVDDGLKVQVNDATKEIIITIYNESQVVFHIEDVIYGNPSQTIDGITYNITSAISGFTGIVPTTLNTTTVATGVPGQSEANVEKAYAGQVVIYKLHENPISTFRPLESDIEVLVRYDADGNMNYYALMSGAEFTTIIPANTGENGDSVGTTGRDVYLQIKHKADINYKVQLEKHVIDEGIALNSYERILPGATYEITVHQEDNGVAYTTFTGITNEFGIIDIPDLQFEGTGNITITLQEKEAPDGYEVDQTIKTLKLYRDPATGNMKEISSDLPAYTFINTDSSEYSTGQPVRVVLKPYDKQDAGKFTLLIDKYSTDTNELIVNNHAQFDASLIQEDETGNVIYEEHIGQLETDDNGMINQENLTLPTEAGEYQLILTETKAPKGYVGFQDSIIVKVTIEKDEADFPIITHTAVIAKDEEGNKVELTEPTIENPVSVENANQLIKLKVGNNIIPNYQVILEKHTLDTDEDLNAYPEVLEGATYEIKVHEEDAGTDDVTYVDTTDENGRIVVPKEFSGFGYVTVTIKELSAPKGFALDQTEKTLRMYRSYETGNFSEVNSNVNYEFINTDSNKYQRWEPIQTIVMPVDRIADGKFMIKLNKYAHADGELITDGVAKFQATLIQQDENGDFTYKEELGTLETENGIGYLTDQDIPEEIGEYQLILREIQAPEGYRKAEYPIIINITIGEGKVVKGFQYNHENNQYISTGDSNTNIIKNAETTDKNTQVIFRNQSLYLYVSDYATWELAEDEYSLDITKVDASTNQPIENMALFKVWLPDSYNTAVYTETSQTDKGPGKLDYCFIEQDKDYAIRLTHMKQPTSAGTVQYVFREVVPPEGYKKIEEDLILTITFEYDEDGVLYIANATSSNEEYLRINTQTPTSITTGLSIDILNYEKNPQQALYKVEYYLRNTDSEVEGYNIEETENYSEVVGTDVTAIIKEFEGFTFDENNQNNVLTGKVESDGSTVLKVYYSRNSYNITYVLNEGEGKNLPDKYVYGKVMYLSNNVTKEGNIFMGWYDNENFDGDPITKIGDHETGDKVFYAKWTDDEYYIKSDTYRINQEENYVARVRPNTDVTTFLNNIDTNGIPKVLNKDNEEVAEDALVGTGYILQVTYGQDVYYYDISVIADLDGNGKATLTDLSIMNQSMVGKTTLEGMRKLSADINDDNKSSVTDLSMINQLMVGKIKVEDLK